MSDKEPEDMTPEDLVESPIRLVAPNIARMAKAYLDLLNDVRNFGNIESESDDDA